MRLSSRLAVNRVWTALVPPVAVGLLLTTVLLSVASAQGSNTYAGCLPAKGDLYNVAIGTSPVSPCKKGDTTIRWNEQGPAGPQGEPGPTGAPGAAGPPRTSFDSLDGLPCNVGDPGEGVLDVRYGFDQQVVLRCIPFRHHTLTLILAGTGSGSLMYPGATEPCRTADGSCQTTHLYGSNVDLSGPGTVADAGSHFVGLSGDIDASGIAVMTQDRTITATFDLDP